MLSQILFFLDGFALIAFGVIISASFLGVDTSRLSRFALFTAIFVLAFIQLAVLRAFDVAALERAYPLVTHLPLVLFFTFFFHKRLLPSTLAVLSAYLCCQLSHWLSLATTLITPLNDIQTLVHITLLLVSGYIIVRYVSPSAAAILGKSNAMIIMFGILPVTYYVFDYATTVFSDALYSNVVVASEFMPFLLAFSCLVFCVGYYRIYEDAHESRQHLNILEMRSEKAAHDVCVMQENEQQLAVIRHDFNHYLSSATVLLENGKTDEALAYLKELEHTVASTELKEYCENNLINTVLSTYASRFESLGVQFECNVKLQGALLCSEIDITSLIANALENSYIGTKEYLASQEEEAEGIRLQNELYRAAGKENLIVPEDLAAGEPISVFLRLESIDGKLTFSLANPYVNTVHFKDNLPISSDNQYGIGTESINYVTHKLKGTCQFSAKNGIFSLLVNV